MENFKIKKETILTGEEIAYVHEGSGKTILLIHGNMSSSTFFSKQ
ncbi:hypothetical protein [Anaerosphaera aminiphila]|nr:hypothetical protein [Anaerosphaera aminiphila]